MNVVSHKIPNESPDAIANRLMTKAEYRDGLQEIAIGIMILSLAGLMLTPEVFKFFTYKAFNWGGLLLFPIGLGSQWVIRRVRKRYLIEKVGYVKLKPVNRKLLGVRLAVILGCSFVIAALVAFLTFKAVIASHRGGVATHWSLFPPISWVILGMGIFGGAIMVFRVRLLHYVIGGVIMVALSIVLAFSGASLNVGLTILYGFAGLLPLVSGCVVFFLFIRKQDEASG